MSTVLVPQDLYAWRPRNRPRKNARAKRKLRPKPKRRFPVEVLSRDEIERLLKACAQTPAGIRNKALIATLYRAGLRIREALSLKLKDLDPASGAIRVLNGKGGKARTVGMDGQAFAILNQWLEIRARRRISDQAPVFCMLDGTPLNPSYIRVLFPRLGCKAGIAKRVHPHGFRHTHAAELRAEGIDVGLISKQLGHSSIATTARYLDHIAPWSVVEVIAARGWAPIGSGATLPYRLMGSHPSH